MAAGRVLIVEKTGASREAIRQSLTTEGFAVFAADSADRALGFLDEKIDVLFCDLSPDSRAEIELLRMWKVQSPRTCFVVLKDQQKVEEVVEAIKSGADDYLAKPVKPEELNRIVRQAQEEFTYERVPSHLNRPRSVDQFVGRSERLREAVARIARAAHVDSTVMILGESGTGKERAAHSLHENSPRRNGPFVAVNVAAVPATLVESELFGHVRGAFTGATDRRLGRFEQADGGTLFIDEIGDFDLSLQPKLLRVIETMTVTPVGGHEDRKVNVRVVVATSRNLNQMLDAGAFREDLYYRLNVVQITMPALRDRPEDVPLLVDYFVEEVTRRHHGRPRKISPALMRQLTEYSWPGNVRQLHNVLESMMVLADNDELTEADLPALICGSSRAVSGDSQAPPLMTMDELEHRAIAKTLAEFRNNRRRAAEHLGISVRTLQRKLRLYELQRVADQGRKAG